MVAGHVSVNLIANQLKNPNTSGVLTTLIVV